MLAGPVADQPLLEARARYLSHQGEPVETTMAEIDCERLIAGAPNPLNPQATLGSTCSSFPQGILIRCRVPYPLDVLRRSPGWWLQRLGIMHAGTGIVLYRDILADIVGDKLVRSVPDRGDRATAFWFTIAAPTLWLGGRLLRSAESADDLGAQRAAGSVLIVTGLAGTAAMPFSGFWALVGVGIGALRRSFRTR